MGVMETDIMASSKSTVDVQRRISSCWHLRIPVLAADVILPPPPPPPSREPSPVSRRRPLWPRRPPAPPLFARTRRPLHGGLRSPPSVSAPLQGERPVVSGLGLSGSPGSARSSLAAGPDRRWRCRRLLAPGGGRARPARLCGAVARRCVASRRRSVRGRLLPPSGVWSRQTCMASAFDVSGKAIADRTAPRSLSASAAGFRGTYPRSALGRAARSRRRSSAGRSSPRPPETDRRLGRTTAGNKDCWSPGRARRSHRLRPVPFPCRPPFR
ncbi:hypothetical protein VPH35_096947 [Triticum aestivum]